MAGFSDNQIFTDTCIRVFNPETKQIIGVFQNGAKAANKLGIKIAFLYVKCGKRERIFSPIFKKEFACRVSVITKEDEELIKKTKIKFPL